MNSKDEDQILRINGFYSYTDEANIVHRVDYVADENGYKILSKAPSVPTAGRGYAYGAQEPKGISTAALASLGGSWAMEDRIFFIYNILWWFIMMGC